MADEGHQNIPAAATVDSNADVPSITESLLPPLPYRPTPQPRPLGEVVLELIEPWRESSDSPPFSKEELIVIALIVLDEGAVTIERIQYKIYRTFDHYCDQALSEYMSGSSGWFRSYSHPTAKLEQLKSVLSHATDDFDMPITRSVHEEQEVFEVIWNAARVYLRRWLGPPRKGTFDFLGLPAELREKMLMVFPESILRYKGRAKITDTSDDTVLVAEKLSDTCAILRVCKTIHYEALPVFYDNNILEFDFAYLLFKSLKYTSPETRREIRNLYVAIRPGDGDRDIVLRSLPEVPLASLVLRVHPRFVGALHLEYHYHHCLDTGKFEAAPLLQWIVTLASRAVHVQIVGDGYLEKWLVEEIAEAQQTLDWEH
ncbi:hypothetical protein CBER1_08125 [Cercospora berteroae]|uniref:Fork-head domain-containing protein n=1 Tax=Cercospora berteroae TaxID=357750 RepID=A0A2S6BTF2_9PEZI|nr:hypothetical protein CBER1_08125 [Cercospora berteroae]